MATPVEAALRRAAADLNALKARWALIGGLAISVRLVPRFTKDLDFAVAVAADPEAEGVVHRLKVLAGRNQDLTDLEGLIPAASAADLDVARNAVKLIQARGFNREQDVVADLDKLIADMRR